MSVFHGEKHLDTCQALFWKCLLEDSFKELVKANDTDDI